MTEEENCDTRLEQFLNDMAFGTERERTIARAAFLSGYGAALDKKLEELQGQLDSLLK